MNSEALKKILITQDGQGKITKEKALDELIRLSKLEAYSEVMHQEPDYSEFDSQGL